MRRLFVFSASLLLAILLAQLIAVMAFAQQKGIEGRWTGTTHSQQGDRDTVAVFKKDKDAYTGTITGRQGEMPLTSIKVDSDKITAQAQVETPQGNVVIKYSFTLKGDSLEGKGQVDFGGQVFDFDINLKRTTDK